MITTLAVLGFIGFVFGMQALRGLMLAAIAVVGLYLAATVYTGLGSAPEPTAAKPVCLPPTKEDGPWNAYRKPPWCIAAKPAYQMPAAVPPAAAPAPAAAEASPSPARAWELLPWPPGSAEITDHPSAAAQGLLDRLNAAQGLK